MRFVMRPTTAAAAVTLALALGFVHEPVQGQALGAGDVTVDDLVDWTVDFRRWDIWEASELGAANFITPNKRLRASRLVRRGLSVSMGHDVPQGDPTDGFPQLPLDPPGGNVERVRASRARSIVRSHAVRRSVESG